jgi:energy-coupling factor transporter ATP-binding protein EcfA2
MLTSLSLKNFKCFESVEMPLGRITVLIGPNGSGKSSVLHALALLRQSLGQEQVQYTGPFVDVSKFEDLVYRRDTSSQIEINYTSINTSSDFRVDYEYTVAFNDLLELVDYRWTLDGDKNQLSWIGNDRTGSVRRNDQIVQVSISGIIGRHARIGKKSINLDRDSNVTLIEQILRIPGYEIASWRYTPAPRGFTRGNYNMSLEEIDEIRGEWDMLTASSNLASAIAYNERVEEKISSWIRDVTGIAINARSLPGQRVVVRSVSPTAICTVPIVNEGFGSNQLTFMFFQLAKTPRGGLDMIEEPELHLHPVAIAKLADLLSREAVESDKQLILTTHSEHLLLGLLNNVAEGKLAASDLVVLYTSLTDDGAKVERVNINDQGLAEGGLPGFFDATLEAQRRHLEALSRRG